MLRCTITAPSLISLEQPRCPTVEPRSPTKEGGDQTRTDASGLAVVSATMAPMSNVIDYSQVEKLRVLRAALLEAHRRTATTMKAGAPWSQVEAEDEKAAMISRQFRAILAAPAE